MHLLVILVIAVLVFGPKRLHELGKSIAKRCQRPPSSHRPSHFNAHIPTSNPIPVHRTASCRDTRHSAGDDIYCLVAAAAEFSAANRTRQASAHRTRSTPTKSERFRSLGVTAILSLQTEQDTGERGIEWEERQAKFESLGSQPVKMHLRCTSSFPALLPCHPAATARPNGQGAALAIRETLHSSSQSPRRWPHSQL